MLTNPLKKCALVDIDTNLIINQELDGVRQDVLIHIDAIAKWTGTDLFLLNPKSQDWEGLSPSYGNTSDQQFDQRLRVAIYGDPESSEHAKLRLLIMIDQIVSAQPCFVYLRGHSLMFRLSYNDKLTL